MLAPHHSGSLTGAGAVINVRDADNGALATGASLKMSYDPTLYFSQSQVLHGHCRS